MSDFKELKYHEFMVNVSASSVSTPYPLDWRNTNVLRTIQVISKNTNDRIDVEGSMSVSADTGYVTLITFASGITSGAQNLDGSWRFLRVRKISENGAATVVGMI